MAKHAKYNNARRFPAFPIPAEVELRSSLWWKIKKRYIWVEGFIVRGGLSGPLPIDQMIAKAQKLLRSGRVERLSDDLFNVVGDHGTYTVAQSYDGKISCNCPGFLSKGQCSHSTAVLLLTARTRK